MARLPPEKNKEDAWLDREDDYPELTRVYWKIEGCPCAEKCSKQAWNKVWAWSFLGEDEVKRYVKHHLMRSSNHHMSADDADGVLDGVNAVIYEETYDEREEYRKHVEEKRARESTKPPEPTEPPPRRRSRSRSGASRGRA